MITTASLVLFALPVLAQDFYVAAGIGNTFFSSKFEDAVNLLRWEDRE